MQTAQATLPQPAGALGAFDTAMQRLSPEGEYTSSELMQQRQRAARAFALNYGRRLQAGLEALQGRNFDELDELDVTLLLGEFCTPGLLGRLARARVGVMLCAAETAQELGRAISALRSLPKWALESNAEAALSSATESGAAPTADCGAAPAQAASTSRPGSGGSDSLPAALAGILRSHSAVPEQASLAPNRATRRRLAAAARRQRSHG